MNWKNKKEMIRLGSERDESTAADDKFKMFVLNNIDTFDAQDWDLFVESVDIIPEYILRDYASFWQYIYEKIQKYTLHENTFSWRSLLRIAMIQVICGRWSQRHPESMLDLIKLENKINEVLGAETSESLTEWLQEKRRKFEEHSPIS